MAQTIVSSVDPREAAYYKKMADVWWDKSGPFWPLHRLNELRTSYIRDYLITHFNRADTAKPLKGLRILDIGCGGGILSESMARLGAEVTGVDVVEKNIHIAKLHARQSDLDIEYRTVDILKLVEQHTYDCVLNMEVIEHVDQLPRFMSVACSMVAPNGVMFVASINRNPLAWLVAIFGAEYVMRYLPRGTHHYRKLVKPGEAEKMLNGGGLRVRDRTGVWMNPFKKRLFRVSTEAVNYMLFATR